MVQGKCTYREFTTGFYFGKPGSDAQIYNSNTYVKNYTYLGTVEEADGKGRCRIEQKNKFSVGETIEIMKPDGRNLEVVVKSICDEDGNEQESAPHPKQILWVDLGADVDKYDILRKKEDN
jgi:putative protease